MNTVETKLKKLGFFYKKLKPSNFRTITLEKKITKLCKTILTTILIDEDDIFAPCF